MPRWISQRRTTCATDLRCFAARSVSTSFPNRLLRPSANGAHASACTPYRAMMPASSACWQKGMRLDLVHGGHDLVVEDQVDQSVGLEVAHADRTDFPLPVKAPPSPATRRRRHRKAGGSGTGRGSRVAAAPATQRMPAWRFQYRHPAPRLRRDEKFPAGMPLRRTARPTARSFI